MLQACLNGARSRQFHVAVPLTAEELARDAAACLAAGAEEFHIHPRDMAGLETFEAATVAAALKAVRAAVPGRLIGISTREGILADPALRIAAFSAWTVLPDYVSVNLSEADAPDVAGLMLSRGVGIEAGIATAQDATRFAHMPQAQHALRVLIEIEEQGELEALEATREIIAVLNTERIHLPRQLHGTDASQWLLHAEALKLGYQRRIGLEDGNRLPNGTAAKDNADMISAAASAALAV